MANPVFVQSNSSDTGLTTTTRAAAFSSAQTAGNCNVVAIAVFNAAPTISSVVDTKGNTYTLAKSSPNSTTTNVWIYVAPNILAATAGANTVTVTVSAATQSYAIAIAEYANVASSSPVDITGLGTGNSAGPATTAAFTTTNAIDLIVAAGACASLAPTGAGTGYTQRVLTATNDLLLEEKVITVAGSNTATFPVSGSTDWNIAAVALKGVSGPTIRNVTVSIAGVATSSSFTGNVLILKNGAVNIAGIASFSGHGTYTRNQNISLTGQAAGTFKALDVEDRIASIAGTATGTFFLVKRLAGVVNIAGRGMLSPFGVFGAGTRITIIGRATTGTLFTSILTRDQITSVNPSAALVPTPFVINNAVVSIAGAADMDPPALSMPSPISADVHIFGLATGSVVAPFEAQAIGFFFSTLAAPAQVTNNGHANFVPRALITRRGTESFAGRATARFAASVTGTGPVNVTVVLAGRASFIPRAFVTNRAQVQIHAGNLLVQTRSATIAINGSARLVSSVKQTQDAIVSIQGSASGAFSALITGPTFVSARFSGTGRAAVALAPKITRSNTVSIAGRAVARFASSSTVLTNINAAVSLKGTAGGSKIAFLTHRSTVSFAGRAQGIFTATIPGATVVDGKTFIAGRSVLTLSPKVTRSSTLSVSGRATGVFTSSSTVLTNVNGDINILGRATFVPRAKVTRSNTVSIAGRGIPLFLGSIQGPNLLNAAANIRGIANLRPQLLGVPVTSKVTFSGRSILILSPFITIRIPASTSLRGRAAANFLAFTQGTTNLNAVLGISGSGFVVPTAFMGSAPAVNLAGRANPVFRPSQIQRGAVGIAGTAAFTPKTPHQALVWISANNLQYKVWQFNLEQMVRVLGTTFTVTSVGLSFQSVALELSSSDAGWGI